MSDVRRDVERSFDKHEVPNIHISDVAKGAGAIVVGSLLGRAVGKRISRWRNNRNLGKHAMEYVKRFNDTRRLVPSDSGGRFRRKVW